MTNEDMREDFYNMVKAQLGFTRERTQQLLAQHFKSFKVEHISQYMLMLRNVKQLETEREELPPRPQPVAYPPCPMCGAPTHGDSLWYGIYTHTPAWRCEKGGYNHFLQWKANEIRRHQGQALVFPEVSHG